MDGIKRERVVCTSAWLRRGQGRARLRQLWVPLSVENNVAIIDKKSLIVNENLRYSQLSPRRTLFGPTLSVPHREIFVL